MDDSANKLSRQRRRRKILMNDDDEDDSIPSKIQGLIPSKPSFTSEIERSTSSSHTERTISSFNSTERSENVSVSKRTFTSSSEFEKSSFTSSCRSDTQKSSYERFSKSEASRVESYSDLTKSESTYRSHSRSDESYSLHKSYSSSSDIPDSIAGLSSIENLGEKGGIRTMGTKLGGIGQTKRMSKSLGSFNDFGRVTRDDRDISIVDTGKSRTYHDKSIKEGHYEKSDKTSSEHRQFITDSEKYSYSDKENTQVDFSRSEHHEVTERRGFVAPEKIMSVIGRNPTDQTEGSQPQDPRSLPSSGYEEKYTNVEDMLAGRRELSEENKEHKSIETVQVSQFDEPDELSEMHVASIRDRVRLMRASMRGQIEEPDQDHETIIDKQFKSDTASDNPANEGQDENEPVMLIKPDRAVVVHAEIPTGSDVSEQEEYRKSSRQKLTEITTLHELEYQEKNHVQENPTDIINSVQHDTRIKTIEKDEDTQGNDVEYEVPATVTEKEKDVEEETPAVSTGTGSNLPELQDDFTDCSELSKQVEPSNLTTEVTQTIEKPSNPETASELSVRQSYTRNVSDEIITIQTGIVTSRELNTDLAQLAPNGTSPKTVGSDEVIIIQGVPKQPSHDTQRSEVIRHEIHSVQTTKPSTFDLQNFKLRSYVPRPYQRPKSLEERSYYVDAQKTKAQPEIQSEDSKQIPSLEEPDVYQSTPHEENTDESMSYETSPNEFQPKDNLQAYPLPPVVQPEKKADDVEHPYETPPHDDESHEFMSYEHNLTQVYETSPAEFQPEDNSKAHPLPPVQPEKKVDNVDHPYETPPHNEDEFMLYELHPTLVQKTNNLQPLQQTPDVQPRSLYHTEHYESTELQPQDEKGDMPQRDMLCETEPHDVGKHDDLLDADDYDEIGQQDIYPQDTQVKEMHLDKTDDYEEKIVTVQTSKTFAYKVISMDTEENDIRSYQNQEELGPSQNVLQEQPIIEDQSNKTYLLESSPRERWVLDSQEFESDQYDSQSNNSSTKNVPYAEDIAKEELPDEKQTDESQQNTQSLNSSDIRPFQVALRPIPDDLEQKLQHSDNELENQISATTRREVIATKQTTMRELHSVNTSTKYETRYYGNDRMLDTTLPVVQQEKVTVKDTKLEPIYSEPDEEISFEPILVLDDLPKKNDFSDATSPTFDSKNIDISYSLKYKTNETYENKQPPEPLLFGIEKHSAIDLERMKRYEVEKQELQAYETMPDESTPEKLEPLLFGIEKHSAIHLERIEPYEMEKQEPQAYETMPGESYVHETLPENRKDDMTMDYNLYGKQAYDEKRHEERSYKRTSYTSQEYELQSSDLQSQNKTDDEPYEVEKQEVRSYEIMSYESRQNELQQREIKENEFSPEPEQSTPVTDIPTLDSDEYSHQSDNHTDLILDSPTRKRKFPESIDETEDHDTDPPSASHVAIKRKVRITTSSPLPTAGMRDVKREESQYMHVPSTNVDELRANQVDGPIFTSKMDAFESTQDQVRVVLPRDELKLHPRDTDLEIPSKPRNDPLRKYRVDFNIQLSPFEKPESKKHLKSWKSEPILNLDRLEDNPRPNTRRWKSMNFEKKALKQSSVVIELQKPQIRPLAPAYSIDNLPFQTIIRNEVNIKLKKKRRKSYPSTKIMDDLYVDEPNGPPPGEIQPLEIQTEHVQLSESFQTTDTVFADNFNVEPEEFDHNKENEPENEESKEREQSPLKQNNVSTHDYYYNITIITFTIVYLIAITNIKC